MKRTRLLALALAVAIMLMGAGYAAWTDQLNINTSVTTGHLNVYFEDGEVTVGDGLTREFAEAVVATGDDHSAIVTVSNLYPGAVAHVKIPFVNDSTIPAKLSSAPTFSTIVDTLTDKSLADVVSTSNVVYPTGDIAIGATDYIEFDIVVGDGANDITEDATVTFDVTLDFTQFNN